jgi:hypothetical protein
MRIDACEAVISSTTVWFLTHRHFSRFGVGLEGARIERDAADKAAIR